MILSKLALSIKNSLKQPMFIISLFTYLSASMAFTVVAKTIVFYMSDMNFSLYHIALAGIFISIPQTYKAFIVALIDYLPIPIITSLGRSKSILIYFNTSITIIILAISNIQSSNIMWILLLCLIGCIFGVCLDAINSGYFNNVSASGDRSWMKGGNVGYNLGVFIALQLSAFLSKYYTWSLIYKYSILFNIFLLPLIIFGPKCTKTRHSLRNNDNDSLSVKDLIEPYKKPLLSLYSMHKAYLYLLAIFISFYRAPDRILGHMLTKIKLDLFGKDMYLILQCISGLSTIISPLIWSELAKTHYKRLKIVNILHTTIIFSLGISLYSWNHFSGLYGQISMYIAMFLFIIIKFARIMESSTCFAYHCDLCEKQYFQTQLAIISSAEQMCGKILGIGIAYLTLVVSQPVLFIIIATTSAPAIAALHFLKTKQDILNTED